MVIELLLGAFVTIGIAFMGWIAVKTIDQGRKIVALEERITAQEKQCSDRLVWTRNMETVLNRVAEDTLAIRMKLGESPHA